MARDPELEELLDEQLVLIGTFRRGGLSAVELVELGTLLAAASVTVEQLVTHGGGLRGLLSDIDLAMNWE